MQLSEIRGQIDAIDSQMLDLFKRRIELCRQAYSEKRLQGKPVLDTQREREILARISGESGELADYAERFFRALIGISRSYQQAEHARTEDRNIVLIGMPGCGKNSVGERLVALTGRKLIVIDEEIERADGRDIPRIFSEDGEPFFRKLEHHETAKAGAMSGVIIATGGGVVKTPENYASLHQNGRIYYIRRPTEELATEGRPLSSSPEAVQQLYSERNHLYMAFADTVISEGWTPESAAETILSDFNNSIVKK